MDSKKKKKILIRDEKVCFYWKGFRAYIENNMNRRNDWHHNVVADVVDSLCRDEVVYV